jgi:hypothetical protein
MMQEVIDETTEVEVGKYYLVRCAKMKYGGTDNDAGFVPVYGHSHKDMQFGLNVMHYHVDGRFMPVNNGWLVDENGRTNLILMEGKDQKANLNYVDEIVIKRRKCRRLTTGINPPSFTKENHKYIIWYNSMIGKSCKGRKCPHYGTLMKMVDGVLECPLHGLKGHPIEEKIIPLNFNIKGIK